MRIYHQISERYERINAELERLESDAVIKTISFSEWASTIVIVQKPDEKVKNLLRFFKRTINPNIREPNISNTQ